MTKENLVKTYDRNGDPAAPLTRVEIERQGLIMATVVVALFSKDGEIWLSLRSHSKSTHAGVWDISVAGCVDADDETNKAAAEREVLEEAGLQVELLSAGKLEMRFMEDGREVIRMPEVFYAAIDTPPQITDGEADGFAKYPMDVFRENVKKYPGLIIPAIDQEIELAYKKLMEAKHEV